MVDHFLVEIDTFSLVARIWIRTKEDRCGNCKPNVMGQESWQFVLACNFRVKEKQILA